MYEQPKQITEQSNNKWDGEWRDRDLYDFGDIVIELEEDYYACDQELADICGWNNIPTDDNNGPYEFCGVVSDTAGNKKIILDLIRMVSIGKDRTFSTSYRITDDEFEKVKNWINKRCHEIKTEQEKQRQIIELFKANGLDADSVQKQRDKLLDEHGLK
jgi:hypothetical protein